MISLVRCLAFFALSLVWLTGPSCSTSKSVAENYEDFSYAGLLGKTYGPNAEGEPTGLDQFGGSFVWVDYAAPWCSPCTPQSQVIKQISDKGLERVVFLTVLTSGADSTSPSTQESARQWASRFGLLPSLVVAEGNSSRRIPQHALFSPLGQQLYRKESFHSVEEILAVLTEKMARWQEWRQIQSK